MNRKVMLTCAVTGAGDTVGKSDKVPVTPQQIAAACVDAAEAGASVVHVHVRDPRTGQGGRDPEHFREVVARIRDSGADIVLNLTAGMGGQLNLADDDPSCMVAGTDLATAAERMRHIEELLPEMCTLDCGSMNFANNVVVNRVRDLERMAEIAQRVGVKPELEVFDFGQIEIARHLIARGLIDGRPLFQLCLGIAWGAPASMDAMLAMKNALPANADWAAFSISRAAMPMVAQAALAGGNCRVGLEDNLYLDKGQLATNGQLVKRARQILESIDIGVLTPAETRTQLGLKKRW
jgi:uncharacterized protein (DUF849 family)